MKWSVLIVALTIAGALNMASSLTLSGYQTRRENPPKVKQVKVTARVLAKVPADGKYVVDLTRKGTIYEFDPVAGSIDSKLVMVRTGAGKQTIESWIEKTFSKQGMTGWNSQPFSVGAAADFRSLWGPRPITKNPSLGRTAPGFECSGDYCTCRGFEDCMDLISSPECPGWFRCTGDYHCICDRRGR